MKHKAINFTPFNVGNRTAIKTLSSSTKSSSGNHFVSPFYGVLAENCRLSLI